MTIYGLNADGTRTEPTRFDVRFRYTGRSSQTLAARTLFSQLGNGVEVLIPDFRLQSDLSVVLSFPAGITLARADAESFCTLCTRLAVFVEPQIELNDGHGRLFGYLRGQLGARSTDFDDIIFSAEPGYLYGADGQGPGLGLGLGWGNFYFGSVHLVGRRYFLMGETDRYDVSLDVEFTPLGGF